MFPTHPNLALKVVKANYAHLEGQNEMAARKGQFAPVRTLRQTFARLFSN